MRHFAESPRGQSSIIATARVQPAEPMMKLRLSTLSLLNAFCAPGVLRPDVTMENAWGQPVVQAEYAAFRGPPG